MRNLDECKTEIFRLGYKKIKERKRRRVRMLSICVPICCCLVALCTGALLPTASKGSCDGREQMAVDSNDGLLGGTSIYSRVEIKSYGDGEGYYKQINGVDKINNLANFIEDFYLDDMGGTAGGSEDKPNNQTGNPNIQSPEEPTYGKPDTGLPENSQGGYVISFSTESGVVVEYVLIGNTLKNGNTGKSVVLTNAQKNELFYELTGGL